MDVNSLAALVTSISGSIISIITAVTSSIVAVKKLLAESSVKYEDLQKRVLILEGKKHNE